MPIPALLLAESSMLSGCETWLSFLIGREKGGRERRRGKEQRKIGNDR